MSASCDVVVAGVGGQGVLRLAHALGAAAAAAGLGVRVGQIYGLSQRGGSVEATVRIGDMRTAFIPPASADVVVGLEPLEAQRVVPKMSPRATVLVNRTPIVPTSLTLAGGDYPDLDGIVEAIAAVARRVYVLDATAAAAAAGDRRLTNTVMLGALAGLEASPIPTDALLGAVAGADSSIDVAVRKAAFARGAGLGRDHAGVVGAGTATTPAGRD